MPPLIDVRYFVPTLIGSCKKNSNSAATYCLRAFSLLLLLATFAGAAGAQALHDIKTIQVEPTEVPNPGKVTDPSAAQNCQDLLRKALQFADFTIGESDTHAHFVLEEFTGGSFAKRFWVGFGAGRSSIAGRVIFTSADGKVLATIPLKVRGNLDWGPYQGNETQQRQAVSSFQSKLIESIQKLK